MSYDWSEEYLCTQKKRIMQLQELKYHFLHVSAENLPFPFILFFFLRAQFHRCLRPCWEGIKGPEDNNPAGKDSLEKNRRCASPSPWLHYHQAHKHHIQHRTTLYCFFPSCQHPRQLCQVRQVPQSTADRSMWLASPLEWLSQVGYLAALQMFERLVHKSYIYPEQLRDSIHPNFKRAVWQ